MGENSKIEWCEHTANFWEGCNKVSEACQNCYAERRDQRFHGGLHFGVGAPRLSHFDNLLPKLRSWDRKALQSGIRPRVFVNSLSDWLDPEVPLTWFIGMMSAVLGCRNMDFLFLTKRPELWESRVTQAFNACDGMLQDLAVHLGDWLFAEVGSEVLPPSNVWIGITAENQNRLLERYEYLQMIPSYRKFLSCEPLLGELSLKSLPNVTEHVQWVIAGGESGSNARCLNPDFARRLRDESQELQIPFLFKQWGTHLPAGQSTDVGRLLDGKLHDEFPLSVNAA